MRKPSKKVSLATIAAENGYTIDHDILTGTTKIYTPDLMEIEFLIEQKGAATSPALATNIGVTAQVLHHIGMLKSFSADINMFGMNITVPIPEAYVLHKIVINEQRGNKSEKDRQAIARLLPYLDNDKANEVNGALSKKDKHIVEKYFEENL